MGALVMAEGYWRYHSGLMRAYEWSLSLAGISDSNSLLERYQMFPSHSSWPSVQMSATHFDSHSNSYQTVCCKIESLLCCILARNILEKESFLPFPWSGWVLKVLFQSLLLLSSSFVRLPSAPGKSSKWAIFAKTTTVFFVFFVFFQIIPFLPFATGSLTVHTTLTTWVPKKTKNIIYFDLFSIKGRISLYKKHKYQHNKIFKATKRIKQITLTKKVVESTAKRFFSVLSTFFRAFPQRLCVVKKEGMFGLCQTSWLTKPHPFHDSGGPREFCSFWQNSDWCP